MICHCCFYQTEPGTILGAGKILLQHNGFTQNPCSAIGKHLALPHNVVFICQGPTLLSINTSLCAGVFERLTIFSLVVSVFEEWWNWPTMKLI